MNPVQRYGIWGFCARLSILGSFSPDINLSENLSIIVPIYNEEQAIPPRTAYLTQLAEFNELILVDGGSSDHTVALLQNLGFSVVKSTEPNRGAQLLAGAEHSTGEILLFHHFDSELPQDYASLIRKAVSSKIWGRFDIRLSGSNILLRLVERSMNLRSNLTGIATGDQAIFVRKNAFFEYASGIQELPIMEDIFLSSKLKSIDAPYRIKSPVLSSSRYWDQHGVITTITKMWVFRLLFFFGVSPSKLYSLYYK